MSNSTDSGSDTPVALQEEFLSSTIDGGYLSSFTTGISMATFLASMYIYASAKRDRNPYILATLILLNGIALAQVGLEWKFTLQDFIDNGDTRYSAFLFNEGGDLNLQTIEAALLYIGYILADGLLLWRCFQMVQGSLRRMWFLYVSYFLEITASVASLIVVHIGLIDEGVVSSQLFVAIDVVQISAPVFAALTSFMASYTICRVILTSTNTEYDLPSRGRFKRIVNITIQTAVLYTGYAVLNAVFVIAGVLSSNVNVMLAAICISDANPAFTAIAPTLMVAQITLSSQAKYNKTDVVDTGNHLSTLNFQRNTTAAHSSRASVEDQFDEPSNQGPIPCAEKETV